MKTDELLRIATAALEDLKAQDILVLEAGKITSLFDYMIIASASSTRQTKALAHHVQEKVKAAGGKVYGIEGEQAGEWLLVDLGDVIVHIMQPAIREYYDLESLWAESSAIKEKNSLM
ncbi:ribosome silencing factor [Nitrosomonas communis]|uniref:ribosome silencing factor n=1 Tax=Nitrosomonas communis TaxID=44574 RepID=UPI0026EE76C5|nr:ribosome silencing factor [Nitrosomonas communis]MCO6428517.1 ribosome silencing factor [Nitrosomonas communis]